MLFLKMGVAIKNIKVAPFSKWGETRSSMKTIANIMVGLVGVYS